MSKPNDMFEISTPINLSMNSALRVNDVTPTYHKRTTEYLFNLADSLFEVLDHETTEEELADRCRRSLNLIAETLEDRNIEVPW